MAVVCWAEMSPSAISMVRGAAEKESIYYWRGRRRVTSAALAIAREDVVRQREQGVALRARRKRIQRLLGDFGEFRCAAIRVLDRSVRFKAHRSIEYAYRRASEFAEIAKQPLYSFPPSAERDA